MPARAPDAFHRNVGHLASVALVILWSSGFVGAELGVRAGGTPLQLLGWRFSILVALLLTVCLVLRVDLTNRRAWGRQAVIGLFSQVGYLFLIFEGVNQGVGGGITALIASLQPLLVATVAGRILGERITPAMWVGVVLGLTGVVVVVSGDLGTGAAAWWAYLLPAAGMLSLTTGTVLTQRLRPTESMLQSFTMQMVVTAIALVTISLAVGQATVPTNTDFWLAVMWLVLLSTLGGYALYVFVTRTRGATVASVLLYLTPPTTMLWVWLMFGVPITLPSVVGMAISAIGVTLVLRSRSAAGKSPGVVGSGGRDSD